MIKTIDEAVRVLNEKAHKGWTDWECWPDSQLAPAGVGSGHQNNEYSWDEAIAIARTLNGDYEALERQVQTLKQAAGKLVAYWDAPFSQTIDMVLAAQGTLRSALSSIEEKTDSGDTLSANQS